MCHLQAEGVKSVCAFSRLYLSTVFQPDAEHPVDNLQALTVGGASRWKDPGSLND